MDAKLNELQKIDNKIGTGAEAVKGASVVVHYTGWLYAPPHPITKETKFDSSRDRNEPFVFPLGGGRVIRGWDEGVAGMKVGGQRTLIIPPRHGIRQPRRRRRHSARGDAGLRRRTARRQALMLPSRRGAAGRTTARLSPAFAPDRRRSSSASISTRRHAGVGAIRLPQKSGGGAGGPLLLYGEQLKLIEVELDGRPLAAGRIRTFVRPASLFAHCPTRVYCTSSPNATRPPTSRSRALYLSSGVFCTQCEAEGFRRIAFFPGPARRAGAVHGDDRRRQSALPGAAVERQP